MLPLSVDFHVTYQSYTEPKHNYEGVGLEVRFHSPLGREHFASCFRCRENTSGLRQLGKRLGDDKPCVIRTWRFNTIGHNAESVPNTSCSHSLLSNIHLIIVPSSSIKNSYRLPKEGYIIVPNSLTCPPIGCRHFQVFGSCRSSLNVERSSNLH